MKTKKQKPEYPMHEKLKGLGHDRAAVQNFIDWLFDEKSWWIAEYGDERDNSEVLFPIRTSREDIMAAFFEIDLKVLDKEKRAMLEELRKLPARLEKKRA